ncbi:hypothetical protein Dcar01_01091 [Deinococcus carri]|uniref:Uncharacterized protein n=1 Tax=Deinococcus carri TaxID=1211323 RepID=A0ABP9W879_9DEIO
MAYTIMLWLVNPGEQIHQDEAIELTQGAQRAGLPGAMSGVTEPPAATRLVYGVYDTQNEAATALQVVGEQLAQGHPLMVTLRGGHVFLIPARRVHYAVMAEVVRPKDVRGTQSPEETTAKARDRAASRAIDPSSPLAEQDRQHPPDTGDAGGGIGGGPGPGGLLSGPAVPESLPETRDGSPSRPQDVR